MVIASPKGTGSESEAITASKEFVLQSLTYPDSAHFHWLVHAEPSQGSPGFWVVQGKVDGVNAFGVKDTLSRKTLVHLEPRCRPGWEMGCYLLLIDDKPMLAKAIPKHLRGEE